MDSKWIDPELFNFILNYYKKWGYMPKAFISGAITNRITTYKTFFNEAERKFKDIHIESYNPSTIYEKTKWGVAMAETLSQVKKCDFVFVLKNWENSTEVEFEIEEAQKWRIPIFYE